MAAWQPTPGGFGISALAVTMGLQADPTEQATKEAFATAREEYIEEQEQMRQKRITFQQELHTKDQQIAGLEREKVHLNTQLEVQAIAYERADYDPMVRKLRQELEDSKVISEALRH